MGLVINNGRVIDPSSELDQCCDLYIDQSSGRISGVGKKPTGFEATEVVDGDGLVVCPGLVDLRAHLGLPHTTNRAGFENETLAAIAGGVTTLCLPPDTHPVIDNAAMALMVQEHAQALGHCRIHPLGALTINLDGEQITEFATLAQTGCVGLSNAHRTIKNTLVLRRAFQYAHTFGLTVFINPQDPWLRGNGVMHEGETSTRLGLPAIPDAAETVDVARILSLIETTGARVHFSQLSSARSVDMIHAASLDGLPVSADVAIHHLHLIDQDINLLNTHCHVLPPLRDQRDRDGLRQGLHQGALGAICSDHQPVGSDAKLTPFASSAPGISSVEHLLPLVLKLVDGGVIDLHTALSRLTNGPAQILGIEGGTLATGANADLCLFDMEAEWILDPSSMVSGGQNTPFSGWPLRGRVTRTVISGRTVFQL